MIRPFALSISVLLSLAGCREPQPVGDAPCAHLHCGEGFCARATDGECHCDGRPTGLGTCMPSSACVPNPCREAFKTQCLLDGEAPLCVCDSGHLPDGDGCAAIPTWDCPGYAPRTFGDVEEPDDCPQRARPLSTNGTALDFQLDPGGDVDWFRITCRARTTYVFEVAASSGSVVLDGYAADGATPLGSDHGVGPLAEVRVYCPASGPLFLRVAPARSDREVRYVVSALDTGPDDYGDRPEASGPIPATGSVTGATQFFGDIDVMRIQPSAGSRVRVAVQSPGENDLLLQLVGADGAVLDQALGFAPEMVLLSPDGAPMYLAVSAARKPGYGRWQLETELLGSDDHGDRPSQASGLAVGDTGASGKLETSADQDLFRFAVRGGRLYRLTCLRGLASGCAFERQTSDGIPIEAGFESLVWLQDDDAEQLASVMAAGQQVPIAYLIRVEEIGVDQSTGRIDETAVMILPGETGQGRYDLKGDRDAFRFTAVAGRTYRFVLSPRGVFAHALRALREEGAALAESATGNLAFKAAASGTHWIEVSSTHPIPAEYGWRLEEFVQDDHANLSTGATLVEPGTGWAQFELAGDVDWLQFEAEEGKIYEFSCTLLTGSKCSVEAFDDTMRSLGTNDTFGVLWVRATRGRYFFRVQAPHPRSEPWSYELSDGGIDDVGDDEVSAKLLTPDAPASGAIQFAGDVDAFTVEVVANHYYELKTIRIGHLDVTARYSGGDRISLPLDGFFKASQTGRVVILVRGSSYADTGSYTLTVRDHGNDDHGDSATSATQLATLPATVTGKCESPYDRDVFSFSATQGELVAISCQKPGGGACDVAIHSPFGTSKTVRGSATYGVLASGTYVLERTPTLVGSYVLKVERRGTDDHGNEAGRATPALSDGIPISGSLEYAGDRDVFSFALTRNHGYQVSCVASTLLQSCNVASVSPTGSGLTARLAGNRVFFRPTLDETLYIEVKAGGDLFSGTYELVVADVGPDDHADTRAAATPAAPGLLAVSGRFEVPNDLDWIQVELEAATYQLTFGGAPVVVRIESVVGSTLFYGTSSQPAQDLVIPTAGTYFVSVAQESVTALGGYSITFD